VKFYMPISVTWWILSSHARLFVKESAINLTSGNSMRCEENVIRKSRKITKTGETLWDRHQTSMSLFRN